MPLETHDPKPTTIFLAPLFGLAPNPTTGTLDVIVRASPRPNAVRPAVERPLS